MLSRAIKNCGQKRLQFFTLNAITHNRPRTFAIKKTTTPTNAAEQTEATPADSKTDRREMGRQARVKMVGEQLPKAKQSEAPKKNEQQRQQQSKKVTRGKWQKMNQKQQKREQSDDEFRQMSLLEEEDDHLEEEVQVHSDLSPQANVLLTDFRAPNVTVPDAHPGRFSMETSVGIKAVAKQIGELPGDHFFNNLMDTHNHTSYIFKHLPTQFAKAVSKLPSEQATLLKEAAPFLFASENEMLGMSVTPRPDKIAKLQLAIMKQLDAEGNLTPDAIEFFRSQTPSTFEQAYKKIEQFAESELVEPASLQYQRFEETEEFAMHPFSPGFFEEAESSTTEYAKQTFEHGVVNRYLISKDQELLLKKPASELSETEHKMLHTPLLSDSDAIGKFFEKKAVELLHVAADAGFDVSDAALDAAVANDEKAAEAIRDLEALPPITPENESEVKARTAEIMNRFRIDFTELYYQAILASKPTPEIQALIDAAALDKNSELPDSKSDSKDEDADTRRFISLINREAKYRKENIEQRKSAQKVLGIPIGRFQSNRAASKYTPMQQMIGSMIPLHLFEDDPTFAPHVKPLIAIDQASEYLRRGQLPLLEGRAKALEEYLTKNNKPSENDPELRALLEPYIDSPALQNSKKPFFELLNEPLSQYTPDQVKEKIKASLFFTPEVVATEAEATEANKFYIVLNQDSSRNAIPAEYVKAFGGDTTLSSTSSKLDEAEDDAPTQQTQSDDTANVVRSVDNRGTFTRLAERLGIARNIASVENESSAKHTDEDLFSKLAAVQTNVSEADKPLVDSIAREAAQNERDEKEALGEEVEEEPVEYVGGQVRDMTPGLRKLLNGIGAKRNDFLSAPYMDETFEDIMHQIEMVKAVRSFAAGGATDLFPEDVDDEHSEPRLLHRVELNELVRRKFSEYQKTVVQPRLPRPYIADVHSTKHPGKLGRWNRIQAPYERHFDEYVSALPEGPMRNQMLLYIRALTKNNSMSHEQRTTLITRLHDRLMADVADGVIYNEPSRVRPGRHTRFHAHRLPRKHARALRPDLDKLMAKLGHTPSPGSQ